MTAKLHSIAPTKDESWKEQIAQITEFEPDALIAVMVKDGYVHWITPPNESIVMILGLLEWAKQGVAAEAE